MLIAAIWALPGPVRTGDGVFADVSERHNKAVWPRRGAALPRDL